MFVYWQSFSKEIGFLQNISVRPFWLLKIHALSYRKKKKQSEKDKVSKRVDKRDKWIAKVCSEVYTVDAIQS